MICVSGQLALGFLQVRLDRGDVVTHCGEDFIHLQGVWKEPVESVEQENQRKVL